MCFQPKQDGAPSEHVNADGEVFVLSVCSDDEPGAGGLLVESS
jgi:hypothetical protein